MANRITTIFDMDTKGGVRNLSQLREELKNAEGVTGKAKVAFGAFKQNAGIAMVGAATAVGTFVANAVSNFTDAALAVGRFSDATGLSADQASRWTEVASDVGVSSDQIQSAFVRLEKAMAGNSAAVRKLGIETVKAKDGTVDMSATMLDAIKRLGQIKDPQEKAALAAQLFGRNFAEMAEIVTGDADQIKAALDQVAGAQIFDDDKIAKAKRMRERLDEFADAWDQVKYRSADASLSIADALDSARDGLKMFSEDVFSPWNNDAAHANQEMTDAWDNAVAIAGEFDTALLDNAKSAAEVRRIVAGYTDDLTAQNIVVAEWGREQRKVAESLPDLTDKTANQGMVAGDTAKAEKILADRYAEERKSLQKLTDQYNDHRKRVNDLIDAKLELVGGERAVREAQRDARTAASELNDVLKDGNTTLDQAAAAIDEATDSQEAAAGAAAQYRIDQMLANGTTVDAKVKAQVYKEELQKLADQTTGPLHDALMGLINDINSIQDKTVNITVLANGRRVNVGGGLAIGGGVIQDGPDTGGPTGLQGAIVRPRVPSSSGGAAINITVNSLDAKTAGKQIVQALNEYKRAGGNVAF